MNVKLSPTRRGAWVVNASKHLIDLNRRHPALTFLENTLSAGQCGSFLIKLSSDDDEDSLSYAKVQAHARTCGLDNAGMMHALGILKTLGAIDWNSDKTEFRVLAQTRDRVLRTTDRLFRESIPQGIDKILPEALEFCLIRPRFRSELLATFSDSTSEKKVGDLLDISRSSGILGVRTIGGNQLFFNSYQFTDKAEKIGRALAAFKSIDRQHLDELLETVRRQPGVALSDLTFPAHIMNMAIGLGLVEANPVRSHNSEESVVFLTAPLLAPPSVGKETEHLEDDVFHHAKMLIASLRYGQNFSIASRGRIADPRWIVGGLLNRDSVGPCTAIGQDYVLLEREGVIRTSRALHKPGNQYSMSLRRREPAEIVLSLLNSGETTPLDVKSLPRSLDLPASYTPPEVARAEHWNQLDGKVAKLFLEALRS